MVLEKKLEKDGKSQSAHHDHFVETKASDHDQSNQIVIGVSVDTGAEIDKCD